MWLHFCNFGYCGELDLVGRYVDDGVDDWPELTTESDEAVEDETEAEDSRGLPRTTEE